MINKSSTNTMCLTNLKNGEIIMAKANKKTVPQVQTPTDAPDAGLGQAQTTTSLEPVQLTIADLNLLGRIVDLASRRGAFHANEMSQVGDAFNKLSSFLAYVESQSKAAETTESTEAQTSTVTE